MIYDLILQDTAVLLLRNDYNNIKVQSITYYKNNRKIKFILVL